MTRPDLETIFETKMSHYIEWQDWLETIFETKMVSIPVLRPVSTPKCHTLGCTKAEKLTEEMGAKEEVRDCRLCSQSSSSDSWTQSAPVLLLLLPCLLLTIDNTQYSILTPRSSILDTWELAYDKYNWSTPLAYSFIGQVCATQWSATLIYSGPVNIRFVWMEHM